MRQRLDAAGLVAAKQHVTEWFPCILCKTQDTLDGAAAFGASLTNMVNSGVAVATLYPACSMDEGNKTGGHGWGLFDIQTKPGTGEMHGRRLFLIKSFSLSLLFLTVARLCCGSALATAHPRLCTVRRAYAKHATPTAGHHFEHSAARPHCACRASCSGDR